MVKIEVKVEGIAPLLMNKFSEPIQGESKRGKKVYVPEEEAKKKEYRNKKGELYLPNTHFKASMVKASADFKMTGRKTYKDYVRAGVFVLEEEIILDQQEYVIHTEPVVIQHSRVMSWRPKFKEWSCSFTIDIVDEMVNQSTLKEILETAGKYKGVGDYRPEYGRFKIKIWKIIK